jgi:MscS family membrane protein
MIARSVVKRHLMEWASKTKTSVDDAIVKGVLSPAVWLVVVVGVSMAKEGLVMGEGVALWVERALAVTSLAILFVALIRTFKAIVEGMTQRYVERAGKGKDEKEQARITQEAARVKRQVSEIGNMLFIVIALLSVLSNLGVDVKAIWASLGIGGIALVVAVKDPLTNIVGRAYIFSTGIFDEGHFIGFGQWSGTVKRIGVFRTTLELFSDMTTVTIPNSQFVQQPVKCYFGRTKFMYKWDLDLPYEVTADKLDELVAALKELILGKEEVNPKSTYIYLDRLDKHSKVVRVWFQVGLPDWATSLHYGSAVLGEIQKLFATMELEFAYPTQTLHVETSGGKKAGFAAPVE